MRDVLEEIVTHADGIPPDTLAEIQRYTKLFWINTGPYNNLTARKFVLKCSARGVHARPRGSPSATARASRPTCASLQPYFFDLDVDPIVTSKTPGPGKDILQASANNLYAGVTMADLEGFEERYPLNSRLVKQDGRLVEEVYRVGGRYDQLHPRDRPSSRRGDSVRDRADGRRRCAR